MGRLSRDLDSLRLDPAVCPGGRFRPATVAEVGVQVLRRLRALHELGLAHGDVKPKNLMLGLNDPSLIHLVDFGLSRPYRIGTLHVTSQETGRAVGTTRFCSIPAHSGERSPRSDLETLAYVLIYIATGGLPWQGCEGSSKGERAKRMLERKLDAELLERHTRERLAGDPVGECLANALVGMAVACRGLQEATLPDYEGLARLLVHGLPPGSPRGNAAHLDWLAA
mmetsp:Transcript_63400/g.196421  ORF Transcript_63400/g.196421 Transcript_63400/m.196421 type:complete len:225 (+) Transcript_63400:50-724(+)